MRSSPVTVFRLVRSEKDESLPLFLNKKRTGGGEEGEKECVRDFRFKCVSLRDVKIARHCLKFVKATQ